MRHKEYIDISGRILFMQTTIEYVMNELSSRCEYEDVMTEDSLLKVVNSHFEKIISEMFISDENDFEDEIAGINKAKLVIERVIENLAAIPCPDQLATERAILECCISRLDELTKYMVRFNDDMNAEQLAVVGE